MDDAGFFELVRELAKNAEDERARIAARSFLKAIADKNKMIRATLGDKFQTWADHVPEGFSDWQAAPGNIMYTALALPDRYLEQWQKNELPKVMPVDTDQLKIVTATAGPRRMMLLPTPVVDQLNKLEKPADRGWFRKLSNAFVRQMKQWLLLMPKRAASYMARNLTGDLDVVIAGAPGVLRFVPQANKLMWEYHFGKNVDVPIIVKLARYLGVINSSMTAQELPDLKNDRLLRQFYERNWKEDWNPRLLKRWFEAVRPFNEYRENILRMAAFMYYQQRLKEGNLTNYGGAKKEVVDELHKQLGVDVAAAHLSRRLLGDYGNISVMGQVLREEFMPFWSWMEINLRRYPRLAMNAPLFGKLALGGKATALFSVYALSRIVAMRAAMFGWNMAHPEKEADLGNLDRANPHIVLCRNQDGSVRIFRNFGALGDFMEWFGMNSAISMLSSFEAGQLTTKDFLEEMFVNDPGNKLWQSMMPHLKGAIEMVPGISTYPNVFQPRSQRRGDIIPGIAGLRDEWRAARGLIAKDGTTARPHYVQRAFFGVTDPRKNALYNHQDLRRRFLIKEGRPVPFSFFEKTKHGIAFSNMREATINRNFEAFREARRAWKRTGKTFEDYIRKLGQLDPIASRLKDIDEIKYEQEFLTDLQRAKLRMARDFARDLEVFMWKWYQDAAQDDDTSAERLELRSQVQRRKRQLLKTATSGIGDIREDETVQHFRDRVAAGRLRRTRALDRFRRLPGATPTRVAD